MQRERTVENEVRVVRKLQAVNRRTPADDMTITTTTLMISTTTAITVADKTSDMRHSNVSGAASQPYECILNIKAKLYNKKETR